MQSTHRDLTSHRVAGVQCAVLAWLAQRLDWEERLLDLEAAAGTPIGGLASVARAS
jgi:hypothetical protein